MSEALDIRAAAPDQLIEGATGKWEVIIGLEVHAQVLSNAKLFSGASAAYGGAPNAHVSLVDAAMPGMLPVINRKCVEQAIRTGLGLNAQINLWSRFDRKNYFYPDLPSGYQISQYKDPIVGRGEIEVDPEGAEPFTVRIERLHLEQDAGKSIHDLSPTETFVDLNRAGVALMEIVSFPDMRSGKEAAAYLTKLRAIVRALGTCDGNMDEGSMRADVNVSVRRVGDKLGTRCEIKNVNSMRFVAQAVEYEARRQIGVLEDGGAIRQETRLFDAALGETRSMRSKEDAPDYRYFPDPDLLPLELSQAWVDEIKATLPKLPDEKRDQYEKDYKLSRYDAGVIAFDEGKDKVFNEVLNALETLGVQKNVGAKPAANVITQHLASFANTAGVEASELQITPIQIAKVIYLRDNGSINANTAASVISIILTEYRGTDIDPEKIVKDRDLAQVTDTGAIEKAIDDLIAANADKVAEVREKPKAFGWWVGQVMKATGGKANPAAVNDLLKKKLGI